MSYTKEQILKMSLKEIKAASFMGCTYCTNCTYMILNVQLTKEEYLAKIEESI